VAERLGSDPARGLSADDAAARLVERGPNELYWGEGVSRARIVLGQLTSPMILLLAAAGVLSGALGDVTEAIVIFVVVALNAWIGFSQDYPCREGHGLAAGDGDADGERRARRDGAGDRRGGAGARRPCNARRRLAGTGRRRLVEAHALRVDESALTGESVPIDKHAGAVAVDAPLAERTSMVYSGTSVAAGRGAMLVIATGMRAELGRVAGLLQGADPGTTPLQRRLDALARRLALAAGAIVGLVSCCGWCARSRSIRSC
jgi:Ca2+-transporting ATPase